MKKTAFFSIISLIAASIQPIHASLIMIENEEQFNKIVNADAPSVVVFSAEWCGGCKALKEPFQKVVDNPAFKHITFAKVDIDKLEALSQKYHVRYLPTIYFMQAGQKKHEMIGRESEKNMSDAITKTFGAPGMQAQTPAMNIEEKKEEFNAAVKEAAYEAEEKLEAAAQEVKEATVAAEQKIEQAVTETQKESSTTEPVESSNPLLMVWNIIASIFNYAKDLIVNFFSAIVSFFKNLFSSK